MGGPKQKEGPPPRNWFSWKIGWSPGKEVAGWKKNVLKTKRGPAKLSGSANNKTPGR